MGGILESIAGAFGDDIEAPPAVGPGSTGSIFDLAFNNPQLMSMISMAWQLGESPSALIAPYMKEVTGQQQAEWGADPTKMLLQTNDSSKVFLDMDAMAKAMPEMTQKLQTKAIANFEDTYQKLSAVPALAGLFGEAAGDTSVFNAKFGGIFDSMAGAALGMAASKGFLDDPTVQANVLGPTALNKAMFEKQLQQQSQQQALALSGAGGLSGMSPNAAMTGGGFQQFQPAVMGAAGLGFQQSLANQQGFMWQAGLQQQQYEAADASLWKIADVWGQGGALGSQTGTK